MKLTSFCNFRNLSLLKRFLFNTGKQFLGVMYDIGTIIVVAPPSIKIHLTLKFIPNKESKLCVDLSILFYTEATNEMLPLCLPSTCLASEPYFRMVILNYFFYFQCFSFHAHVLTSFYYS